MLRIGQGQDEDLYEGQVQDPSLWEYQGWLGLDSEGVGGNC